jgi:hypothetical protein
MSGLKPVTTVSVSDPVLIPDSMDGRFIEIGDTGSVVVENTTDKIRVWGNLTESVTPIQQIGGSIPDFHLREDSPCLDAGIGPEANPAVPAMDVDGDQRSGLICDIGVGMNPEISSFSPHRSQPQRLQ